MFITKLKVAAVVLVGAGVAGGTTGVAAYRTLRQDNTKAPTTKPEAEEKKEKPKVVDRRTEILMEMVKIAEAELKSRKEVHESGRSSADEMHTASLRLLTAQKQLFGANKAKLVAACEAHLKYAKDVETVAKNRFDAGSLATFEYYSCIYVRLQAELWLEEAKAR